MNKPTNQHIAEAVRVASAAFWATIAAAFPEVKSGDMPPDESHRWDGAADRAVEAWLNANHPVLQMQFNREFPDFDDMPAEVLLAHQAGQIIDTSWHNDMCPAFFSLDKERMLFVDYKDIKLREVDEGGDRFWVMPTPGGQCHPDQNTKPLYSGDDITTALKILLNT